VQNRYSFADREWDYVLNYCAENGIGFIPWGPLGSGRRASEMLEKVAAKLNTTPLQVALAWLLKRSPIMLPIPGTSSSKHLEENVAAAALELPQSEFERLSAVTPPPNSLR
jgi:aryl-alcohol dehydrogenase-like predicted oxidoreductase